MISRSIHILRSSPPFLSLVSSFVQATSRTQSKPFCSSFTQYKPGTPFHPIMSAITDSEIISRLEKLSIAHPEVIEHAPVKGAEEWKAELDKLGKGSVSLTKTVSREAHLPGITNGDDRRTDKDSGVAAVQTQDGEDGRSNPSPGARCRIHGNPFLDPRQPPQAQGDATGL